MEADNIVIKTEPYEEIKLEILEHTNPEWSHSSIKTEIKIENESILEVKYDKIALNNKCIVQEIYNDWEENNLNSHNFGNEVSSIENDKDNVSTTELQLFSSDRHEFTNNKLNHKMNLNNSLKEDEPMLQEDEANSIKPTKKFSCQFCEKCFYRKMFLDNHLLKFHKNQIESDYNDFITSKVLQCEMCCYETTYKNNFIKHLKYHENQKSKEKKSGKKQCQLCSKIFASKKLLDYHMFKIHKQVLEPTSDFLICKNQNSYDNTQKTHLTKHVNKHNRTEHEIVNKTKVKVCQFCPDRTFIKKAVLDEHLIRVHRNIVENNFDKFITNKIHDCPICGYKTVHLFSLKKHLKTHDMYKLGVQECQFCFKYFNDQIALDNHILGKHKKEVESGLIVNQAVYTCDSCSYKSRSKSNLDAHLESHNIFKGEWNKKCMFCGKLKKKSHLDDHLIQQHYKLIKDKLDSYILSEIYKCSCCSYMTTNKASLYEHRKNH